MGYGADGIHKAPICGPIEEQIVDVITKPLTCVKFEHFQDKLGVVQKDLLRRRE